MIKRSAFLSAVLKLTDFMDMAQLQKIQNAFSDATGPAAIAVDNEGNYITKRGVIYD